MSVTAEEKGTASDSDDDEFMEQVNVYLNTRTSNNNSYSQMILTDPENLEDYFITETYLDYAWNGVNDQHNWYPMFNSLIDYINKNSKAK